MSENSPVNLTINFFIFGGQDESEDESDPKEAILKTWQKLTPREKQIALLAARNLTNNEIAYNQSISPETVKTHIRNALRKFGLRSKTDLRWVLVTNGLAHPAEGAIYGIPGA